MLNRRQTLLGAATLALPAVAAAQGARVLRMVPQANLGSFDPIFTTADITRNYGYMIYDTLYGMTSALEPTPQMAAGHVVEDDGRHVTVTLRDGLAFHDGSPVRAVDVVASLRRWMARNPFGQKLAAVLDELSAKDDGSVVFRLQKPFPLLFHALAGLSQPPFIMPERVAKTDPFKQIDDTTGSVPLQARQVQLWQPAGVRAQRRLPAPRRAAQPDRGCEGCALRPGRMEHHHRRGHLRRSAATWRDRLV